MWLLQPAGRKKQGVTKANLQRENDFDLIFWPWNALCLIFIYLFWSRARSWNYNEIQNRKHRTYSEADLIQWIFNQNIYIKKIDLPKPKLGEVGTGPICLGITDAGRCCLIKQQLRSLAAVATSHLHISFPNVGLSATWPGREYLEKPISCRNRLVFMISGAFSKISAAPTVMSLLWSGLTVMVPGLFEFLSPPIDFPYLSARFLQDLMNREDGLSWNCYGWNVMVAWSYRATAGASLLATGPNKRRGVNALFILHSVDWSLEKQRVPGWAA